MLKNFRSMVLTALLMLLLATPVGAEALAKDMETQARDFLELLDQGRQDESWNATSDLFKGLNEQDSWKRRQETIRHSYGTLFSRQISNISYRQNFALSPDGQYVIVQFESTFQNRSHTNETVVLDCSDAPTCSVREYIIR